MASAYLTAWCKKAVRSKLRPFVVLAARIRNNVDGLIAADEWGLSNSRLEGINAKIRLINNRAHGHAPSNLSPHRSTSASVESPSHYPHKGEGVRVSA